MDGSGWQRLVASGAMVVLDGGLATELERAGYDLADPLWSARLLVEQPRAIAQVHRDALAAGADIVTAATYQASFEGFARRGIGRADAERLLRRAIDLAADECSRFRSLRRREGREAPSVAASIGPYGAFLADGSEYRGGYGVARSTLRDFHQPRWDTLAQSCPLLACETLPDLEEAQVLLELLDRTPDAMAWFSFVGRDDRHIADGTPIVECARRCAEHERVVAVGVNCTAPRHLPGLIAEVRQGAPEKPVVAYPNSGERYDTGRGWHGRRESIDFARSARQWRRAGASWIGGCCRTGPAEIRALRRLADGPG